MALDRNLCIDLPMDFIPGNKKLLLQHRTCGLDGRVIRIELKKTT